MKEKEVQEKVNEKEGKKEIELQVSDDFQKLNSKQQMYIM